MRGHDIIIGLIVVIIWGLNFIFIKLGLKQMPPLLLGALRFLVASLPAIFFLPRPQISWRWLIALGLTINVGQFSFLFLGMKLGMPAGLASLILQAQVFFTFAAAVKFLGEKWHWNHLVGLILAGTGMAVIGYQQNPNITALGFGLTLAAAASWGIGNVIMRKATNGASPFSTLGLIVWIGVISILPLAILSWFIEGPSTWKSAFSSISWITIISIVYIAYLSTLIGYGLWGKLLSKYPASVVSPFALLVPVIGISSSSLLLKETLSFGQILGSFLVMFGLIIHIFGGKLIKTRLNQIIVSEELDNKSETIEE